MSPMTPPPNVIRVDARSALARMSASYTRATDGSCLKRSPSGTRIGSPMFAPARRVLILTKAATAESNTGYAQGGIAAAVGPDDSPALHARDTLKAGDGLCDEAAVAVLVEEGPTYVRELMDWGARFARDQRGEP